MENNTIYTAKDFKSDQYVRWCPGCGDHAVVNTLQKAMAELGIPPHMTAVISGEADIGFMGAEASIYAYQEGATDPVVNFAQLTQRAGNFLVAREEMPDFKWEDLKGKKVLGGRAGGMPQMVFEYILKKHGIDPKTDLTIDQSISFGLTAFKSS